MNLHENINYSIEIILGLLRFVFYIILLQYLPFLAFI